MDIAAFKRELFAITYDLQKILHDTMTPICQEHGLTLQQMHVLVELEIEGILSGQLLNNRLLINGNFGYRDNPLANTNFIGDFEAEWLLNRSGDIRLKAYNETNDRYYTRTNLTTQGIGIMYKKDFNKWSELLFWNKWKLRNLRRKQAAVKDSIPNDSVKETQKAKSEMKREHPM